MTRCRIYFFTYNRNYLIPRSIESLLNQTFQDWVCEVHNDCPTDHFPEEYIKELNDPRFIIKNHISNLGPTKSFNLAYSGCSEEYATILEDDNWWEPKFLAEMISILDENARLEIAWSNMRIWQETNYNIWEDTGKTTWPQETHQLFRWREDTQALAALHSNGAMIYRGINAVKYLIPDESLFDAVELIRERSFEHPIYLHSKVLANFSKTKYTSRSPDPLKWTTSQAMLLSSIVVCSENKDQSFKKIFTSYRCQKPSPAPVFFIANLLLIKQKSLYRHFDLLDWLIVGKWMIINSLKLISIKRYILSQNAVYAFLLKNTALRLKEI